MFVQSPLTAVGRFACCDLTRSNHPALWYITWDPSLPVATRPLAIQKDGTWYTYGWDLTKNVCEVYGQHGHIRSPYTYSTYGETSASGDVKQPIQWSCEFNDSELGLFYFNYRYYNPNNGRWVGKDLSLDAENSNLYLYASNAPVQMYDVWGNFAAASERRKSYCLKKNSHRKVDASKMRSPKQ